MDRPNFYCAKCDEFHSEFVDDPKDQIGSCMTCGEDLYARPEGHVELQEAFLTKLC